jgi:hypothetical protein
MMMIMLMIATGHRVIAVARQDSEVNDGGIRRLPARVVAPILIDPNERKVAAVILVAAQVAAATKMTDGGDNGNDNDDLLNLTTGWIY